MFKMCGDVVNMAIDRYKHLSNLNSSTIDHNKHFIKDNIQKLPFLCEKQEIGDVIWQRRIGLLTQPEVSFWMNSVNILCTGR